MNNGICSYTRNNGWRRISPVERASAIVWLNDFEPTNAYENRAKKILTYFLCDNLSAQAICRKQDPDIVSFSNRKKGKPLSTESILRVIYSYFPQFEGRNKSTIGNKRVELMRKREKEESGHIKQCAFCGSKNNLEEHHMIPLFLGGTNDDDNLVYLCKKCHRGVSNYQTKLRLKNEQKTGDRFSDK